MLSRLIEVPEDISNHIYKLSSIKISEEHYDQLKTACLNLLKKKSIFDYPYYSIMMENYAVMFYQHFPGKAYVDKELKQIMNEFSYNMTHRAFKHENENSTIKIIDSFSREGIENYKTELVNHFKNIASVQHVDPHDILQKIYKSIKDIDVKFSIYSIIKGESTLESFIRMYGGFLLDEYSDLTKNTVDQNNIIKEIKEIINPAGSQENEE